uniref:ATP/GTP binding protein-like 4 n=1 Tax=Nothobranchius pienaari TaxID=704102 RepID=A0A1A8MPX7_9TELE
MEENTVRDVEAGSETGGEDALVGNINKLMVSPPGYAGIPRKGHLVFDACFESGNLGHVDYISDFEFDLFIRPDTCNPRFRLWFNFTVENVRETQQQRRLDLLTITNSENVSPEKEKKLVFLTARVHPGESPASFVCQGVIDFLVGQHPVAQILRDHVIFKIVPMLNPDGVYLGNYRCSLMGFDLNRHWQDPSPWAHPTLHAVKQLIVQMNQDPMVSLEFYIDVHAHSTMLNGFMYGNVFEDKERVQRQAVFPRLLCQNAPDFSFSNTSFNRDVVKAGTGRRFLGGLLDDTSYCYTLEVSFYSYMTAGSTAPVPYSEEAYMKLGRNVARTFQDYYKLNIIKDNRPNQIQSPDVELQTGNSYAGKGVGVGKNTSDREKERNQSVRH